MGQYYSGGDRTIGDLHFGPVQSVVAVDFSARVIMEPGSEP
jgi:hypothetical protein